MICLLLSLVTLGVFWPQLKIVVSIAALFAHATHQMLGNKLLKRGTVYETIVANMRPYFASTVRNEPEEVLASDSLTNKVAAPPRVWPVFAHVITPVANFFSSRYFFLLANWQNVCHLV